MDNNQPYNNFDEQFNDLPLPGEEQSWQQMKKLLDEDENNRRPVVPIFLKSCAGWGLALMIIGAATWFLLKPQRSGQQKDTVVQTETKHNQNPSIEKNSSVPAENDQPDPNSTELVTKTTPGNETTLASPSSTTKGTATSVTKPSNTGKPVTRNTQGKFKTGTAKPLAKGNKPKTVKGQNTDVLKPGIAVTLNNKITTPEKSGELPGSGVKANQTTTENSLQKDSANKTTAQTIDSSGLKQQTLSPDSISTNEKKAGKKTQLIVSAGVGLQQQIPLGGQQAVPYDYYGRTGSLSDYIPSVYLRVEKEGKWFVQGEFRYGAPQTLADFQYSRQTKVDSQNLTVTSFRLKKTYYHQLPISFNYYVLPNLSVGVGGIYNRFHGAVTEKEVKKTDLQTQVETMSKEIVHLQHFNDSFLYKTQVHALFQTEYHWNRFDFGLRYTKDIQPYIKYTQPDGHIDVKKNQTFQLLVRFRIWHSKKKFSG